MRVVATRRDARERAVQILFGLDLNSSVPLETALSDLPESTSLSPRAQAFLERLVRGVVAHRDELDAEIASHAEHWNIARMGTVERNVLRIGVFELLYHGDVPPPVVINEAVDIAKYFGSRESGRFINGILDQVRKHLARRGQGHGREVVVSAGEDERC